MNKIPSASAPFTEVAVGASRLHRFGEADGAVGERCSNRRRHTVRSAGGATSAYADMSSENAGEKPARRKPQGS
jgi:hypothetical protein